MKRDIKIGLSYILYFQYVYFKNWISSLDMSASKEGLFRKIYNVEVVSHLSF